MAKRPREDEHCPLVPGAAFAGVYLRDRDEIGGN